MKVHLKERSMVEEIEKAIQEAEDNCDIIDFIELTEKESKMLLQELGEGAWKTFSSYKATKIKVV